MAMVNGDLMSDDRVVVIIPHYGDDKLLEAVTKSLIDDGVPQTCVVVVNNNENNRGFTAACNIGLDLDGYDFAWLINNDIVVQKDCLKNMLKYMEDPEVGIVGCKNLHKDEPDKIHHGGTTQCFPAGVHKGGLVSMGDCAVPTYEKWVTFASVLLRKEMVREIGLMDKRFFNYYSDADYCYRARDAGWKIVYAPDATVLHHIGQSQHPNKEQQKILYTDMIRFRDKWLVGKAFFDLDKEIMAGWPEKK